MRRFVCWLAPVWTMAASVYLLFGPTYTTVRESVAVGPDGTNIRTGVISKLAAAVILTMFCLLLIVSIGIFYTPGVIALIIQVWQQKTLRSAV